MWYSPDELELYLIDFKRGVEFKPYVTFKLPHARAIAVESDREFGLSVLQRLDAELGRRGEMYRRSGVQDLAGFRRAEPQTRMPRVLLVVDEFQELFTEDDKLSQEASLLVDRLVRQGRAFGMHVVLGSQTIGGSTTLPRTTMGQMAVRVALQCTEADSQLILGDTNSAARLLTRPGEAIYNDAGGAIENNSPFQVSWLTEDERETGLSIVRKMYEASPGRGLSTVSFEGNAPANASANAELAALSQEFSSRAQRVTNASAFLGEAVAIKPPTQVVMKRRAGCNVLIIGQQAEQASSVLAWAMISLSVQSPRKSVRFVVLGMDDADEAEFGQLVEAARALPQNVERVQYRDAAAAVVKLAEIVRDRLVNPSDEPIYFIVSGLQRFRELRKAEEKFAFNMDATDEPQAQSADKAIAEVLRDGPTVGVHTIAWVDTAAALDRTLERGMLREFDHRILLQMSAADSSVLIDSPVANKLGFFRAVYFSEEQGTIEKFRPYAMPVGEDFVRIKAL